MAKITVAELKTRGRFTTGEFDWDNWSDETAVEARLAEYVNGASLRTQQVVGTTNYSSTDAVTAGCIKEAEMSMALVLAYRDVVRILASRPEEAPPPAYVNLDAFRDLIAQLEADFVELTAPYRTTMETTPGLAFGFVSTGIDETERDDYSDINYDSLGG